MGALWVAGSGKELESAPSSEVDREKITAKSDSADRCRDQENALRSAYAAHMAAKRFSDAAQVVGSCARSLGDPALLSLAKDAAVQFHLAAINRQGATPGQRADAIEAFSADHPAEAKGYVGQVAGLRAEQAALVAAEDRRARRKSGVRIGMTAADVLASSWGAPEDVNRTTTAHGVREQWVYNGGYLYFEDGKLTTIQN